MPGERGAFLLAGGTDANGRSPIAEPGWRDTFVRCALGSHVICENRELPLEEAPRAYKNITIVIDDLVDAGIPEAVAILGCSWRAGGGERTRRRVLVSHHFRARPGRVRLDGV